MAIHEYGAWTICKHAAAPDAAKRGGFQQSAAQHESAHCKQREIATTWSRQLKFGAQGANRPISIAAEAGTSRAEGGSDEGDLGWPGRDQRRRSKAGVKDCFRKLLIGVSPPNKNAALIGGGAISAPGVDLSVEISVCKLSMLDSRSPEEGDVYFIWQKEFSQDFDVGVNWRKEFENPPPDEGKVLDDLCHVYLIVPEGKLPRDMAKEEIAANWQDVKQAKITKIKGFYDLCCFQRHPRDKSHNAIDARWAIIWNMFEGNVGAQCRFTVRGFRDNFQDFDIYAGATSRSGQRIVNAVVAELEGFSFISFDVSQTFAKGLIFVEFSRLTGIGCRAVQFDVPRLDLECFEQIKGFESFNPATETLTMLKPI